MGGPGSGRGAGRPAWEPHTSQKTPLLLAYLSEGMGLKEACSLVGVAPSTVRKAMNAGKHDLDGDRQTTLAEFAIDVERAMAEAKHLRIKALNRAAETPAFWAAAAWWLERRYPNEFGRQDRVNMNMSGSLQMERPVDIELEDSELDALRSVLSKLGAGQGDSSQDESFGLGANDEDGDISLP